MILWGYLMRRSAVSFAVVSVIVVLASTGASAQNLLVNPDFDTDVVGWSGLGIWDPMDAFGSPTSGSATWTNTWASGGALYFTQCVEISAFFEGYDISGYIYIPAGQAGGGHSYINAVFYSDSACADVINGYSTPTYSGFDTWQLVNLSGWMPGGSASARIGIANIKSQTGDFQIFHDAIFFGPNPAMIFGDGFESVDVSGWSNAVGYP